MWRWNGKASWRDRVTTMACRLHSRHTPPGHVLAMLYFVQAASQLAMLLAVVKQATYPCHPNNNQRSVCDLRVCRGTRQIALLLLFLNSEPKLSPVHCSVIMLLCPSMLCLSDDCPLGHLWMQRQQPAGASDDARPSMPWQQPAFFLGVCCVLKKLSCSHRNSTALVFPFSFFCVRA
jgi:hypothetical protein